jgi:hypothetical protein
MKSVRDFLRCLDDGGWSLAAIARYFKISNRQATALVTELCKEKYLSASDRQDGYRFYRIGEIGRRRAGPGF